MQHDVWLGPRASAAESAHIPKSLGQQFPQTCFPREGYAAAWIILARLSAEKDYGWQTFLSTPNSNMEHRGTCQICLNTYLQNPADGIGRDPWLVCKPTAFGLPTSC